MVGEIKELLDEIVQPVKTASTFYSYYYLTEVEGVDEFAFDLKQKTDTLYDAFWTYGLYSVSKELENMGGMANIRGDHIKEVADTYDVRVKGVLDYEYISPNGLRTVIPSRKERDVVLSESMRKDIGKEAPIDYAEMMELTSEVTSTPLNPVEGEEVIEKRVGDIIKNDRGKEFIESAEYIFSDLHWESNFGGEQWASICRAMLKREELSSLAWVDLMWSLQHNTGVWLDQIGWKLDDEYLDSSMERLPEEEVEKIDEIVTGVTNKYEGALIYILDMKKEGNFEYIYPFAINVDRDLRKYKSLLKDNG